MKRSRSLNNAQSRHHGSEGDTVAIYRSRIMVRALLLSIVGFLVFEYFFPQYTRTILALAALSLPFPLVAVRRAIIFTRTEVIYRPAVGSSRRVVIAQIQWLTKCSMLVSDGIRAVPQPAIKIVLPSGATETWPLFFDRPDEILQRLSSMTGKAIERIIPVNE